MFKRIGCQTILALGRCQNSLAAVPWLRLLDNCRHEIRKASICITVTQNLYDNFDANVQSRAQQLQRPRTYTLVHKQYNFPHYVCNMCAREFKTVANTSD